MATKKKTTGTKAAVKAKTKKIQTVSGKKKEKTGNKSKPANARPTAKPAPAKKKEKITASKLKAVKTTGGKTAVTGAKAEDVIRKKLIADRESLVKEAKTEIARYIKGETRQVVESGMDDGDLSVIDLSEDINFKRLAVHRERLIKIDEALRKLKEGTYGICEECGEEINLERLKVMPFAIYCRDCQEKKEELEKVAGEEEM